MPVGANMLATLIADDMQEKEVVDGFDAALLLAESRSCDVGYVKTLLQQVADELHMDWGEEEE